MLLGRLPRADPSNEGPARGAHADSADAPAFECESVSNPALSHLRGIVDAGPERPAQHTLDAAERALADERDRRQSSDPLLRRASVVSAPRREHRFRQRHARHTFASMLIVGLKTGAVSVSRQLGHRNATITLNSYAHLFDQARNSDTLRDVLSQGFGGLLEATVPPEPLAKAPDSAGAAVVALDEKRHEQAV